MIRDCISEESSGSAHLPQWGGNECLASGIPRSNTQIIRQITLQIYKNISHFLMSN